MLQLGATSQGAVHLRRSITSPFINVPPLFSCFRNCNFLSLKARGRMAYSMTLKCISAPGQLCHRCVFGKLPFLSAYIEKCIKQSHQAQRNGLQSKSQLGIMAGNKQIQLFDLENNNNPPVRHYLDVVVGLAHRKMRAMLVIQTTLDR